MAKEITHESLQDAIVAAKKALQAARDEYKQFCKDNPYQLPKQPTLHELRKLREKLSPTTAEDHAKANALAAKSVQKAALVKAAKEG